jgi:hypothetical protein
MYPIIPTTQRHITTRATREILKGGVLRKSATILSNLIRPGAVSVGILIIFMKLAAKGKVQGQNLKVEPSAIY